MKGFSATFFWKEIRPSQKLQADINEFDRMREDDSRKNLRWLIDAIDRLLQRERMLEARVLQTKRIQSGAVLTNDSNVASVVAPAPEQGTGKGKGEERANTRAKRRLAKTGAPAQGVYLLPLACASTLLETGHVRRRTAPSSMSRVDSFERLSATAPAVVRVRPKVPVREATVRQAQEEGVRVKAQAKVRPTPRPRQRLTAR